jgi:hypothetical protein
MREADVHILVSRGYWANAVVYALPVTQNISTHNKQHRPTFGKHKTQSCVSGLTVKAHLTHISTTALQVHHHQRPNIPKTSSNNSKTIETAKRPIIFQHKLTYRSHPNSCFTSGKQHHNQELLHCDESKNVKFFVAGLGPEKWPTSTSTHLQHYTSL